MHGIAVIKQLILETLDVCRRGQAEKYKLIGVSKRHQRQKAGRLKTVPMTVSIDEEREEDGNGSIVLDR